MNQLKTESRYSPAEVNTSPLNPYFEAILAAFIMGSSGVFIKYLSLPAVILSCFRLFIPTLLLFIYFKLKRKQLFRHSIKWMLFGSLLNAIRIYFFMKTYDYTGIANAVLILYTWPIFATLFSYLILKERVPIRNVMLLLFPFAGIMLIFSDQPISIGNKDLIGMSSMLVSAVIYALSVIIFKKESQKYTGYETVFFQNLIGGLLFLPFLFIIDFALTIPKAGILILFATSIGILAFGLFFSALGKIKASTVSFIGYLEVVIAVLSGVLIYDEKLTWNLILGGSLIIFSTIMLKKN